jgi:hypothetical protein
MRSSGSNAAIDDLYERIAADYPQIELLEEVDDVDVLRSLVYRALTDVVFWKGEAERWERELLEESARA